MVTRIVGSAGKVFRDKKKVLNEERNLADETIEKNVKLKSQIVNGKYSKRDFDINNCGGKILNLKWKNAKITKDGIAIVKKHLSRFEEVPANIKMVKRLEEIEANKIKITDYDKRFYTHEIRESERFIRDPWPIEGIGKASGVEAVLDLEDFCEIWLRGGANRFQIKT